ncbi:hypothetical protein LXL04_031499 [Taraxacum kok-saghyz]
MAGAKEELHTFDLTRDVGFTSCSSISNSSCDVNTPSSPCSRLLSRCGQVPKIMVSLISLHRQFPFVSITSNAESDSINQILTIPCCGEFKNNLSDWNCEDPTRLLSLILEHRIYTWHTRENVLGRLKFEIHTIYS